MWYPLKTNRERAVEVIDDKHSTPSAMELARNVLSSLPPVSNLLPGNVVCFDSGHKGVVKVSSDRGWTVDINGLEYRVDATGTLELGRPKGVAAANIMVGKIVEVILTREIGGEKLLAGWYITRDLQLVFCDPVDVNIVAVRPIHSPPYFTSIYGETQLNGQRISRRVLL